MEEGRVEQAKICSTEKGFVLCVYPYFIQSPQFGVSRTFMSSRLRAMSSKNVFCNSLRARGEGDRKGGATAWTGGWRFEYVSCLQACTRSILGRLAVNWVDSIEFSARNVKVLLSTEVLGGECARNGDWNSVFEAEIMAKYTENFRKDDTSLRCVEISHKRHLKLDTDFH